MVCRGKLQTSEGAVRRASLLTIWTSEGGWVSRRNLEARVGEVWTQGLWHPGHEQTFQARAGREGTRGGPSVSGYRAERHVRAEGAVAGEARSHL